MVLAQLVPLAETAPPPCIPAIEDEPVARTHAASPVRLMTTNQNIPQMSWEEQEEYIPSQEDQAEWAHIIESSSPERLSRPP